jgi:hypothetical protein
MLMAASLLVLLSLSGFTPAVSAAQYNPASGTSVRYDVAMSITLSNGVSANIPPIQFYRITASGSNMTESLPPAYYPLPGIPWSDALYGPSPLAYIRAVLGSNYPTTVTLTETKVATLTNAYAELTFTSTSPSSDWTVSADVILKWDNGTEFHLIPALMGTPVQGITIPVPITRDGKVSIPTGYGNMSVTLQTPLILPYNIADGSVDILGLSFAAPMLSSYVPGTPIGFVVSHAGSDIILTQRGATATVPYPDFTTYTYHTGSVTLSDIVFKFDDTGLMYSLYFDISATGFPASYPLTMMTCAGYTTYPTSYCTNIVSTLLTNVPLPTKVAFSMMRTDKGTAADQLPGQNPAISGFAALPMILAIAIGGTVISMFLKHRRLEH